ncbi:alpha-2-macroglobulin-like [Latimeria chalumnae]|uniref:alpha-2-macroglobulin-like n=1 Tax=Latimeria chalumnae TaxID=7897 RepID=UPI00313EFAAC
MWKEIFVICLLLQLSTAGSLPQPTYLVTIPSVILSGATEKVCAHLAYLNETIQITLTLTHGAKNTTLLEREVREPHWYQCISFQVPAVTKETVGSLVVHGVGDTFQFEKSKKVLIQKVESGTFVQTDKPIYKPGQTVKFRIVSLDRKFIAVHQKYPVVQLQDPKKNRIAQWLNVETQQGITDLQFVLNSDPPLGTYILTVEKYNESRVTHSFKVEEYVLPKFEVQVKVPHLITILEKQFAVDICGKYTYGKPMQGDVHFTACRFRRRSANGNKFCQDFTGKVNKNGCFSQEVNTEIYNVTRGGYKMKIEIAGELTEEGTGTVHTESGSIEISSVITTVTFEDTDNYYKPGIPYSGKIKLEKAGGTPLPKENIHLLVSFIVAGKEIEQEYNYTTDSSGRAYFTLDTSSWNQSTVSLRASFKQTEMSYVPGLIQPRHNAAHTQLNPFYSKSNSFLKIQPIRAELSCGTKQTVQADYIIFGNELENKADHVTFRYLVMSKGEIVLEGHKEVPIGDRREVLKGTFLLSIPISPDVAPIARILIYTIFPSGEVLADAGQFTISKCFRNKVKLEFSTPEDLPGAEMNLHLQASPGSLCAIRAVDQSVLLLQPEAELSSNSVYNLLPVQDLTGYKYNVEDLEPPPCLRSRHMWEGTVMRGPWRENEPDVYNIFKRLGLKLLTDAPVKKPISCRVEDYYESPRYAFERLRRPGFGAAGSGMPGPEGNRILMKNAVVSAVAVDTVPEPVRETVRKYFPETSIWDLVPVGSSGEKQVPVTIPDTITEWKAGMFCMADVGFGISPTVSLNAFKPFFLEPTLPYSVIRGEAFTLKATVFNYLSQCIMVQVTLKQTEDFLLGPCDKCDYTSCLCADEGKTFSWNVTPKTLGEVNFTLSAEALRTEMLCANEAVVVPKKGAIDTVIKPLLVEPEGTEKETTHSSLICPAGTDQLDSPIREEISVQVPEDVVEGSARAYVSVLGDIMGSAMQNLDRLLAMPFGCGEQNMVLFAPNIYILQYLQKTEQLTASIKAKAVNFLESGYRRELNYKHNDGSYSAFGNNDPEGNTWLTAFVLKSFSQAQPFIFIDEKHLKEASDWLLRHQKGDGCFLSVGKLIHSGMKGGVDDEVSLTAYITAALLELHDPSLELMVKKSLSCLEKAMENVTNVYTLALMAYTFTLAEDESTREALLKKLDTWAIKKDGMMHWERTDKPKQEDTPFFWCRAPSAEVEMTAYVLLALMSKSEVTSADIGSASMIVKWITKQQNPYGGFSSTQDTVVALHALSKYAGHTFSKGGEAVTVTVKSDKGFQTVFRVDDTNRLLLQQADLPHIPATYSNEVKGKGCVLVQTVLKYNIPPPKNESTFTISVETIPNECTEQAEKVFDLKIQVRYTGKRSASNMAIIDIKMLSGFIPVKKSVKLLEKAPLVKKLEIQTTHVIIYLEELKVIYGRMQYILSVEQDFPVKNLKPAIAKIYDYYETDESAITEYSAPCKADDDEEKGNTR